MRRRERGRRRIARLKPLREKRLQLRRERRARELVSQYRRHADRDRRVHALVRQSAQLLE